MDKDNCSTLQNIMELDKQNISLISCNQNTYDILSLNNSSGKLFQAYMASRDEKVIATVYFVWRLVESGLAIIGNLVTILVCFGKKRMQTNTNLLITSLAIGDLLSGLDTPFYMLAEMQQDNKSGHLYCIIAQFVDLLGGFGNTFSITCLALDRMIAVQYPIQYMRLQKKQVLIGLFFMWAYITCFLSIIFAFGQSDDFKYPICFFKSNLTSWAHDGVIYGHVTVLSLLTVVFYVKVWRALDLRNSFATRHAGIGTQSIAAKQRLHRRVMRMLGLVVAVYFTLALPITVGSFCGLLTKNMTPLQHAIFRACWAIWYMNSFINPFLYVWSNSSFREALGLQVECVNRKKMECVNRRQEDGDRPRSIPAHECEVLVQAQKLSSKGISYTPSTHQTTV